MIASQDRSGYFGASDTDKVVGNYNTKSFKKWWLEKIGIDKSVFSNVSMKAGTYYEHRILKSLGIEMQLDAQVILEDILLRVNLDGNTDDCIYECKTYKYEKGFKVPLKYKRQVWVQMYATGIRKAYIVAYGLKEEDYKNFFNEIDKDRIELIPIEYNESWINTVFLPKIRYLSECLRRGIMPSAA